MEPPAKKEPEPPRHGDLGPNGEVPMREKLAYSVGSPVDGLASGVVGNMTTPIFVLLMGVSPSVLSLVGVLYRVFDAFTDVAAGWLSDNARTRWGRRRPFIFAGAICTGLWMPVIWFFPQGWPTGMLVTWMVGCWMVRDVFASGWNIPFQCLLLEMTPSAKERTNISAMRSYFGNAAGLLVGWVWFFTQLSVFNDASGKPDIILGARWITSIFAVVVIAIGVLPALFVKERFYHQAEKQPKVSLKDNFRLTFTNKPFVLLVFFTLLFTIGTSSKNGLAFFTKMYYVFGGDQKLAATVAGTESTITLFVGFLGIPIFQWIAKKYGNRNSLMTAMAIVSTASVSTLFTYTPAMPYLTILTGILLAPATAGMWVVIPPMLGDIVDFDELRTGERREGSFSSIYSWQLKMAFSIGGGLSGPLVELVGFRVAAGIHQPEHVIYLMRVLLSFIPLVFVGIAMILLARFPLNRAKMAEVNAELVRRRGEVGD
jgi:GPH family glycoside/pentoside/hexuronide:cation symporter